MVKKSYIKQVTRNFKHQKAFLLHFKGGTIIEL